MRFRIALPWLALILLGCTRATTPTVVPATPGASTQPAVSTATATAAAAVTAIAAATAALTPSPAAPTPTSFTEGLTARLATPDSSPNCPDHYPWFFDNLAQECASTVLQTWAAFEPFEHGLMVWIAEGGHTYVLLDDGSPFKPYQEVVDPQGLPLPGPDPNLAPPAGLFQPELGFGKFWRGGVAGYDWVRQRLGWATARESSYGALWQCNTASDDAARCYFTGPRDQVLVLARGSAQYWAYWQGPVR